ncbi:MAG TPA: UDP binding domain-containing protein, partial [Planctomycetota bacterium]|nr:UDP binding domain-containing protein [Planctomycetota bacterium]
STVFPGVTDRLAARIAARGLAIDVAYCPERIAQGRALEELAKLPQIVSGNTPAAVARSSRLFGALGSKIIELRPVEAELAKLFCNAWRYINFAISNQFYVLSSNLGADFHAIHAAVTSEYPRLKGFAGAGLAAGPCLLKDTMQLAAFNHNSFVLGQAAMMVNEGLPSEMVKQLKKRHDLASKRVAILGMAFKGNCDDERSSLSYKLRKLLTLECKEVICSDPYVQDPSLVPLDEALARADLIVLGACHDAYRVAKIDKPVLDVFRFLEGVTPA